MGKITVIGVGFEKEDLTLKAVACLQSGAKIILHTASCGAAEYLNDRRIPFAALDHLYEAEEDFDLHARAAADAVRAAAEDADVMYCVMDVRDLSAVLLMEEGARVVPGVPCEGALFARCPDIASVASAADWEQLRPDASNAALIREIDSRELACEVKLRLMEAYPDEARTLVLTGGTVTETSLYLLDRLDCYDHRTSALIYPEQDELKRNGIGMNDLEKMARSSAAYYRNGDPDALSKLAATLAGGAAYGADRGEFTLNDLLLDARDLLSGRGQTDTF